MWFSEWVALRYSEPVSISRPPTVQVCLDRRPCYNYSKPSLHYSHCYVCPKGWPQCMIYTTKVPIILGGILSQWLEGWLTAECCPGVSITSHLSHFRQAECQSLPSITLRSAGRGGGRVIKILTDIIYTLLDRFLRYPKRLKWLKP